jgi:sugar phosphate isomerase/epimerase
MSTHQSNQSRRSFLKFGAATLAAAALARTGGGVLLAADDAPAGGGASDEYAGLKMGIQSYTLRDRSFEKMLEAMKNDLKLHYVELFPNHLAGKSPTQVKEKLDAHQVKAVSYGVVAFKKDMDANRKLFELAKTHGMQNLSCDPEPDAFDSLDKLTEEYKITVAIHPHGPGHRWAKIETIQNAIKDHSKMIGLCADTGHIIRAGEDPLKALEAFKDRLYALHLKDFKKTDKGGWEDVPAGDATLNVDAVVKFLIDNKSAAPVFIEYEGGNPVPSAQKSLERVKQAVKRAKGG